MKKNLYIFILLLFIILLVIFCIFKQKSLQKNTSLNESNADILKDNTTSNINSNGENSGIYVGVTEGSKENYLFISIKIDKESSEEEQIKSLLSEISKSIGYIIDINNIEIDGNKIKIDFADTGAPFDLNNKDLQIEIPTYFITSESLVAKTIFDSIDKTLKSYFGNNTEIYFSVNQENINIKNELLNIDINKNNPY